MTRPGGTSRAVGALADALEELHLSSGAPSTRRISQEISDDAVPVSHTTVHQVLRGKVRARWEIVEKIVDHLGGDTTRFKRLWIEANRRSLGEGPSLSIGLDGISVALLHPGGPDFVFGRGQSGSLMIGRDDRAVSRAAGSIRWSNGGWLLRNDSAGRSLVVLGLPDAPHLLTPGSSFTLLTPEARPVMLRVPGTSRNYDLDIQPVDLPAWSEVDDEEEDTIGGAGEVSMNDEDRPFLAAMYLSGSVPGEPVSFREAVRILAGSPYGRGTDRVRSQMVRILGRWNREIAGRGLASEPVTRKNLGRILLSLGLLSIEDRALLPQSQEDEENEGEDS